MSTSIYKFLHLAHFKDIPNWSVQYADEEDLGFTKKYPMARIGTFLVRRKESIDIEDGVIYKRVTVSTKGGEISIRDEKDGKQIGTKKQFVIHEGQFLLSKIDARNGAFGVVPSIAEGAIITGNFWTFDVDYNKVNPLFLTLVTKTKQFLDFAEKSSNGTTNRHYLQEESFLHQLIPLPSIEEQKLIVDEYNIDYKLYLDSQNALKGVKSDIFEYISSILYLKKEKSKQNNNSLLHFKNFRNLISWSVDNKCVSECLLESSLYNNRRLCDVVTINPRTDFQRLKSTEYISFIPMQSISDEYARWIGCDKCTVSNSKGYTKFKEGDLLWAKITPCMQNGKSAIVHGLKNGFGCGSTEFYVLRTVSEDVDLNYIHCLLRLDFVLKDAMNHFTGSAGQQRVPVSYLENLLVPIPPISVQHQIVNHIRNIYLNAEKIQTTGMKLAQKAKLRFEQIIFEYNEN